MSSDNLVASEKFPGSVMKKETSDPYSLKIGQSCKISLTTLE